MRPKIQKQDERLLINVKAMAGVFELPASSERGARVTTRGSYGHTSPTAVLVAPTTEYRGTLLIRKRHPPGPYTRTMPRDIWWP